MDEQLHECLQVLCLQLININNDDNNINKN